MSSHFDEIVILFNPNSTGDSKKNALAFAATLKDAIKSTPVTVRNTEYAGHAEEIAAEYVATKKQILLISSSGDGGYNEVVNGVLRNSGAAFVATAVLPSGNANDHYNSISSGDLSGAIEAGTITHIEALKLTSRVNGKTWTRYAHSYIGFGLTPKVGRELTALKLNVFNEKWHTFYHMLKFKHVDLMAGGTVKRFSNLVFATITQMSKIVKLDTDAKQNDGLMEVYETEYRSPLQLFRILLLASLKGLSRNERSQTYDIKTIKKTLVQLDGEVFTLDGESDVEVTCIKGALRTVV